MNCPLDKLASTNWPSLLRKPAGLAAAIGVVDNIVVKFDIFQKKIEGFLTIYDFFPLNERKAWISKIFTKKKYPDQKFLL